MKTIQVKQITKHLLSEQLSENRGTSLRIGASSTLTGSICSGEF
jgi:hypothetical protein